MKLSRCSLLLVMVVLMSYGSEVKSSEAQNRTARSCDRPEILLSHLDIYRYNRSYPYVDYNQVLKPIIDIMLQRPPDLYDIAAELALYRNEICKAKDPEAEAVAWKNLVLELNHRLHTDESVYKISKILFGDRMAGWMMNPSLQFKMGVEDDETSFDRFDQSCMHRLVDIYCKRCGRLGVYGFKYVSFFSKVCTLQVAEVEFVDAVIETCGDYVYVPNAPWEE